MKFTKKIISFAAMAVYLSVLASGLRAEDKAHETPVKSLYSYKLDNGLSLFVAENHSVPLTYIEIAVKCGAFSQKEETAGLFHLYEHMMFKGNGLYKDASSVNRALSDLGVSDKNGSTSLECVNYFFTVPSDMTEKGLEFWNAAIRTPKLDPDELEVEKKVVLSEINAHFSDTGMLSVMQKNEIMFPEAPYKLSAGGTVQSVSAGTVKQLKAIQKKFYVPNNAALFVGGDVNPEQVYAMVKKIFGSWKKGPDPYEEKASNPDRIFRFSKTPFENTVYAVLPYDRISPQLAQIEVSFRGPDCISDEKDTYAADVLGYILANPEGVYKQTLCRDPLLFVPDPNYVWSSYPTRKTCGEYSFSIVVQNPSDSLAERAEYFAESIPGLLSGVARQASDEMVKKVVRYLEDYQKWSSQTAKGLLETMRFWWCCADENYYYSYSDNLGQTNPQELQDFVYKYFIGKAPLVTVYVNPSVYEAEKADFERKGFKVLGRAAAEKEE